MRKMIDLKKKKKKSLNPTIRVKQIDPSLPFPSPFGSGISSPGNKINYQVVLVTARRKAALTMEHAC